MLWTRELLEPITVEESELQAMIDLFACLSIPLSDQPNMLQVAIQMKKLLLSPEHKCMAVAFRNAYILALALGDMYYAIAQDNDILESLVFQRSFKADMQQIFVQSKHELQPTIQLAMDYFDSPAVTENIKSTFVE